MTNLTTLILLAASCAAQPAAEPAPAAPALPDGRKRTVAIGDLHADLPAALSVLRLAGLVDESGAWAGGDATFVQTGDLTDRGPDSLEVIELMDRLQREAEAAGGQVVSLLGNHEVMNLTGDLRYVSPGDVADFGSAEARAAAFAPAGPLGASLLARDAVALVGDTVFVHGGVSARTAEDAGSVGALAAQVRAALSGTGPAGVLGPEGPLWYRGYLQAPEPVACEELGRALSVLGAERMVVGHTTQRSGKIAVRCEGRLLGIDTGISSHYGGNFAAVELREGAAEAIYPEGRTALPVPEKR